MTRETYRALHSAISYQLRVGRVRTVAASYPELVRYLAYKHRLFRSVYQEYELIHA